MKQSHLRRKALELVIQALRIEAIAAEVQVQHLRRVRASRRALAIANDDSLTDLTPTDLMEASAAELRANRRLQAALAMQAEETRA